MSQYTKFLVAAALSVLAIFFLHEKFSQPNTSNGFNISKVDKYTVSIAPEIIADVKVENPGIGSSLKLKEVDSEGNLLFYSITDRGLNLDTPNSTDNEVIKIFPIPDFQPFISLIKVSPGKSAIVESVIKLEASGLPLPPALQQAKMEIPLDINFNRLECDAKGIDSEGLAVDRSGNFWVAEEYMPSLLKFSPDGKLLERIGFDNGIPEILKYRLENRGIEALTITPSGKLVYLPESVLNIEGKTAQSARFIRLMEFDPKTRMTKMYAYEYDDNVYKSPDVVKIGDIVAIDDHKFLLIEQGKKPNGEMRNTIQLIDTKEATEISALKLTDGKELEFASAADLKKINTIKKQFVADVKDLGWPYEKMEGIAYIDPLHIAIINDNDFSQDIHYVNGECQCKKNYQVDLAKKQLLFKGQATNATIGMKDTQQSTQVWVLTTDKPLN
jgi:hypothetical protein